MLFAVICWYLWKSRNKAIFKQKSSNSKELLRQTENFVINIYNAARVEGSSELVRNIPIKWKSPSHGWVKISIDGAFNVKGN